MRNRKDIYSGERSPYWDWVSKHSDKSYRGEDSREELPEANPDVLPFYQEEEANYRELVKFMKKALKELSTQEKQVTLMLQKGYNQVTISKILKLKSGTIKSVVFRVRNKLKKSMRKYVNQSDDRGDYIQRLLKSVDNES
jgi:RNA polymerase sigma factor (sigma-70 family)